MIPFGLAGSNVGRATYGDDGDILEDDNGKTDIAFNLGGGLKFTAGSFRPRVVARFAIGNDNFTLFAMIPFQIAQ